MTVKELLTTVGFDAIVRALQNTHRNDESISCLAGYKEAFDIICNSEFNGPGGDVTFNVTPKEHWSDPGYLPLIANNVEGDFWENTVGKTVIRPKDNPFTDAELAGAILWGMTFYGFTNHNSWKPHEERFTPYAIIAERLERKLYLPYIRDKRVKQELKEKKEMPFGIAFTQEVWDSIHFGEKHCNRSKRKRFYRLERRIVELKRLDKRQHLIDDLIATTGVSKEDLETLIMKAGSVREEWRESHVCGKTSRIDYIIDLISNYYPTLDDFCQDCHNVIIVAYADENNSITDEEFNHLSAITDSIMAKNGVKYHLFCGHLDDLKGEIALRIIGISNSIRYGC
ncbi:MAG: hypothetical protein HDS64_06155 [Bacteroidales bacterium]|nr:hypothetical protein [Bacteroidales bacterium]